MSQSKCSTPDCNNVITAFIRSLHTCNLYVNQSQVSAHVWIHSWDSLISEWTICQLQILIALEDICNLSCVICPNNTINNWWKNMDYLIIALRITEELWESPVHTACSMWAWWPSLSPHHLYKLQRHNEEWKLFHLWDGSRGINQCRIDICQNAVNWWGRTTRQRPKVLSTANRRLCHLRK